MTRAFVSVGTDHFEKIFGIVPEDYKLARHREEWRRHHQVPAVSESVSGEAMRLLELTAV